MMPSKADGVPARGGTLLACPAHLPPQQDRNKQRHILYGSQDERKSVNMSERTPGDSITPSPSWLASSGRCSSTARRRPFRAPCRWGGTGRTAAGGHMVMIAPSTVHGPGSEAPPLVANPGAGWPQIGKD